MAVSGIYEIRCAVNGKKYIGSAVNITKRWSQHRSQLRNGSHRNRHLQNSWDKHGEKAFAFTVVESVEDLSKLIDREQYFLDNLEPEFNIAPRAGSRLGVGHSKEVRAKMAASQEAAWKNEARRTKVQAALRKRWRSETARKEASASYKARWADPDNRKQLVAAQKAVWDDPDYRAKRMNGLQGANSPRAIKKEYSIRNEFGETLTDVPFRLREQTGLSSGSMGGLIRGKYKTAKGWSLVRSV